MLELKDLKELAKVVSSADSKAQTAFSYKGENFSYKVLNETLRKELNEYAGDYSLYRKNKNLIFELMEETLNEVIPVKVIDRYGMFAEIKQVAQGDKVVFTNKITNAARRRAKRFITRAGYAGIYEVFKLDSASYEIKTNAHATAVQIGFEEFLDGRVDFNELLNIVMEGLEEAIFIEIEMALNAAIKDLQPANKYSGANFDAKEMDRLLQIADSYGSTSVIYCTLRFASEMVPDSNWISNDMKNEMWVNGHLGNFHGHRVVILPQSYEDETNAKTVIDDSKAWIIAGDKRPVKVVLEGDTIVDEFANYDRSREVQIYKKFGIGVIFDNDVCLYVNESLAA